LAELNIQLEQLVQAQLPRAPEILRPQLPAQAAEHILVVALAQRRLVAQ
jgi:hypothetical protein